MKKRAFSMFLILAMLLTLLPQVALPASAEVYSGTCGAEGDGSNLTWTLDTESGLFTISGSGEMPMWPSWPWEDYRDLIVTAVVEEGVTSIGDSAFKYCKKMESITIGSSVNMIGHGAFNNCFNLKNVYIFDLAAWLTALANSYSEFSVTNPIMYANNLYLNGTLVTDLVIPEGSTVIANSAFYELESIKSVSIPGSMTSIDLAAFSKCKALAELRLSEGLVSIGDLAFYETALQSVTIPSSVTSIGSGAFGYTGYLNKVEGFTIYGYEGSAAETYANENGFTFVKLNSTGDPCADGHTPGDPVKENEVAPTCTAAGGYDSVVYCAVCGAEINREHTEVAATGHHYVNGVCTVCGAADPDYDPDKPQPENPFEDVADDDWFYNAVMWATTQDPPITNGTDATHFSPSNKCTRAEIVQFLWNAAGKPAVDAGENPFSDVSADDWYYTAVMWAVANKITNGTDATHFAPTKKCTRAEVVMFLWNAAGKPEIAEGTNNPFDDVAADAWYKDAVLWAVERGITSGTTPTTFAPTKACTRAEVVQFLYKAS